MYIGGIFLKLVDIIEDVKTKPTLSQVIEKYSARFTEKEITDFIVSQIKKQQIKSYKKGKEIVLFYNEIEEVEDDVIEQLPDNRVVTKLARRFRSNRYKVERDVIKNKVKFSFSVEKKNEKAYILYVSDTKPFKHESIFAKMLKTDKKSIRIVVNDESTKKDIINSFNRYLKQNGGIANFRQKYTFHIITKDYFFENKGWKELLI